MKKSNKIILGILTIWPILYIFIFMAYIFLSTFLAFNSSNANDTMPDFFIIFILHFFTILMSMALLIYYVINIFKNDRVKSDQKALWAIILFVGNMIAMPIYFYLFIWKEPTNVISE
jgi:hypothetical protein